MKTSTRKNVADFIEQNRGWGKFPDKFTIEMFEKLTIGQQQRVLMRIGYGVRSKLYRGSMNTVTLNKSDFPKSPAYFRFTDKTYQSLCKVRDKYVGIEDTTGTKETTVVWSEIDPNTQNAFKTWLSGVATKYDKGFTVDLFDKLSDTIKIKFLHTMAKKFKVYTPRQLKMWIPTTDKLESVKSLKIDEEIKAAIIDVIPVSQEDLVSVVAGDKSVEDLSAEELARVKVQVQQTRKIEQLKAAAKAAKTTAAYEEVLNDPLFDRSMYEIILKRMRAGTALKSMYGGESKDIIKLIVTHPLATTEDLMEIRKIKSKNRYGPGSSPMYASSYLNSELAAKGDAPKDAIMSLVKLAQFDIKLKALDRTDLTDYDIDVIIDYTVKLHAHMPDQVKQIFGKIKKEDLLNDPTIKRRIIKVLEEKYQKGPNWNTKPTGMAFLETVDEYGWLDELPEKTKLVMGGVISKAYKAKVLSKERIKKIIGSLKGDASVFLLQLYEETKDEDFLPKTAQEIFLF